LFRGFEKSQGPSIIDGVNGGGQMHRLLFAVFAALIAAASAQAQTTIIYDNKVDENLSHTLRYDGEGWRNLRLVWFATRFLSITNWKPAYIVCQGEEVLIPWKTSKPSSDYDVYPGKTDADLLLEFGGTRPAAINTFFFSADADQESRFLKALASPCQKPPRSKIAPQDIDLSISDDQHFRLVPDRFIRTGDRISAWIEGSYFRRVTGKQFDTDWEYYVADEPRGRSMTRYEIDCKNFRIAASNFVTYDAKGAVKDSEAIDSSLVTLKEAVPGSMGDAWIQTICLVQ
jgi:hypothetical protein